MTKLSKSSRTHSHCLAAEENEQTIASLCSSVLLLLFATPGGNEKWRRYCRYKVAGSQQQSAAYYLSSVFLFFCADGKRRRRRKECGKRNAEHFGRARVPVSFHFGGSGRDNNRRIPFLFWLLGNNKQLERKWRDGWDPESKSARYLYAWCACCVFACPRCRAGSNCGLFCLFSLSLLAASQQSSTAVYIHSVV